MGHQQDEFAAFYQASRDSCLKAVAAVVGDRQLAEDLVAEAFARAWMSWGKVSTHAAPRAWVVRTALNAGISWWRRRREVPLADHDAAALDDAGGGVDPALIAALRRLPTRQREVLAVQQQLLGGIERANGDHAWGHDPASTPLYGWLEERGLLDPANPPLKP